MSVRLAAAAAVLCTLFGDRVAHAEDPAPDDPARVRRPVAVIELSDSKAGNALAIQLGNELNNRDDLKPLDRAPWQAALIEAITDEDAEPIQQARDEKRSAEDNISGYKFSEARTTASRALARLEYTTPTPTMTALYAELSFVYGAALLGERQPKDADAQFRLAHTIDPAFKPDGIRYLPEVIDAYQAAIKAKPAIGKIGVTGTGHVFLDGREVGEVGAAGVDGVVTDTRNQYDVPSGPHVVWLVGVNREPRAKHAMVPPDRKEEVVVESAALDDTKRIHRLRRALKQAPDAAARSTAILDLAGFLQVGDAVLVTAVNGKVVVQTWRDRAPGFSALREYKDGDKPIEVLAPLLPPKRIVIRPKPVDPPRPVIPVETVSWYRKPRYQIIGGAGVAFAIGVVVYSLSSWDRRVGVNPNPGFPNPSTGRQ